MWYGSNCGGLNAMFVDSKYLQVHEDSSKDEGYDEDTIDGAYVVGIDGLLDKNDNGLFAFDGVHNNEHKSSSTPMDRTFSRLQCNGGDHNQMQDKC